MSGVEIADYARRCKLIFFQLFQNELQFKSWLSIPIASAWIYYIAYEGFIYATTKL